MKLTPQLPPGRRTRKARAFAADIGSLRAQGYTFEAIRAALADAGVQVSRSTVQREAARHVAEAPRHSVEASPRLTHPATSRPQLAPSALPKPADSPSGKDIAEAFVRHRITNPLIRSRSSAP